LESRFQEERVVPCQYVDTIRKAIDCATILRLTFFIQRIFAADFSPFIVEIVQNTINLGTLSPFGESCGRRRTLVDGSLESPCRVLVKCEWTSFYSAPQCSNCKRSASCSNSVCLSVRPSVCPLNAGIVSKRRHVARCSLHCRVAKCV